MAEEQKKSETSRATKSTETGKKLSGVLKEFYARSQKQSESGGPVAWCGNGIPPELLDNFEIRGFWPENYGTVCAATQTSVPFLELAEADGFSVDICSYVRNAIGYSIRRMQLGGQTPPEAPRGGMGNPSMMIDPSHSCDPKHKWFHSFNRYMKVPMHIYDTASPPEDVDCRDPEIAQQYIEHNTAQMRSLVDFFERQTGRKLDKKRLAESLIHTQEAQLLYYEVNELRKATPSPMASQDHFAFIAPMQYMRGTREVVEIFRELRDEIKERVEKGIGVIPNEKHRVLWGGIPMWFNLGIFNYLEGMGAVSVIENTYGHGTKYGVEIDPDDPVKAIAEQIYWNRVETRSEEESESGSTQADRILEDVRDYAVDGVIIHTPRSCRATSIGQQHTKNVLTATLQVPTVHFETDMGDARTYSDAQVMMRINAFLEALEVAKSGDLDRLSQLGTG